MPFTLDETSLLIKGRKGDTASFTFDFNQDMSDYTVHFYVKKNLNSEEAIIDKTYDNISGTSVTVNLTTTDTEKLAAIANSYNIYYWGLKINNGTEFAQTVIPQEFNNPPMMYIYPEIGGA
ncbi:MAG: hypothetical protein PHC64_06280 [Candidatus Gastranaerophilales bacterium]|nr:hypothetical protein [Candidatus Gastranaerophilales bacterium]